jgi:hypothetical protein
LEKLMAFFLADTIKQQQEDPILNATIDAGQ